MLGAKSQNLTHDIESHVVSLVNLSGGRYEH